MTVTVLGFDIWDEANSLLPIRPFHVEMGLIYNQRDESCCHVGSITARFISIAEGHRVLTRLSEPAISNLDHLHELKSDVKKLPLTAESLDSRGHYLYDDGLRFILWFGRMLSADISVNLLGQDCAADLSRVNFCQRDQEMSRKKLLKKIREDDPSWYQLCSLLRQGEQPKEGLLLLTNLVEDQVAGSNGYVDWFVQIQRQVQQNA